MAVATEISEARIPHMSKTLRNVLAVFIFWVALFIVNKTGALTISSWISVACIARQSNRQPNNSMLFNVVNAICHLSGLFGSGNGSLSYLMQQQLHTMHKPLLEAIFLPYNNILLILFAYGLDHGIKSGQVS